VIESQSIITELGALSYVGIWITALLSNIVIPIPEEVVLLGFGYLAGTGHIDFFILLPLVISGLFVSDIGMYLLAKKGSRIVTWFYEKFFSKHLPQKNDQWFADHMNKIIFFSRFLIQLRFIGPFLAGQKKVPFKRFALYDLAAIIIYVPLYTLLGLFFHSRVQAIIDNIGVVRNIALVVIGLFLVFGLSRRYIRRVLFGKETSTTEPTPTKLK
jgi:membrane protein DedA with SNARE-associated domain